MTLAYTTHLRFAVPDFLTEPWHDELRAAFDQLDAIVYQSIILQGAATWLNSTAYAIGNVVVSPDDGLLYTAAQAHTSSAAPTTFTQEKTNFPGRWVAFAPTIASNDEAIAGVEATHYMTPATTKSAILTFSAGTVGTIGTPVANTLAAWNDATHIRSEPTLIPSGGDLTIKKSQAALFIDANPLTVGHFDFLKDGKTRWQFQCVATVESGGQAGSELHLYAYDDAGTGILTGGPIISATRVNPYVQIRGTGFADNASAGYVGEYLSHGPGNIAVGANAWTSIASISLMPGDWELSGSVQSITTIPSGTVFYISISSTTNAADPSLGHFTVGVVGSTQDIYNHVPPVRVLLGSTQTQYLTFYCPVALTVSGLIRARRQR